MTSSYSLARVSPNELPKERFGELPAAVVLAARDGDDEAFATIVRVYYARCLRFAMRFALSHDDAEDCVQDTFVRLHRALPRYQERHRFNAWLFRILANRCRTMRSRARWRLDQINKLEHPATCWQSHGDGTQDRIARAVDALPSNHREAFLLRHVEGFSYDHIAAITGVTVTAARMRVSRACNRLRAEIGV
jgi:RNA polymerase sigma-70 factor (ECF subfamily)